MEDFNDVKKPSHYCDGRKFEPKDVIRAYHLNFNVGNAVKYISRCHRKGNFDDAVRDVDKAITYLEFEIDYLKKHEIDYSYQSTDKTLLTDAITDWFRDDDCDLHLLADALDTIITGYTLGHQDYSVGQYRNAINILNRYQLEMLNN